MSAQTLPQPQHRPRSDEVVAALEARGLLDPARHDEAAWVIDELGAGHSVQSTTLRRVLAEVAGYVGAAFVLAAVAVFLAPRWLDLPLGARIGLLVGAAVILAAAGAALGITGGGMRSLRTSTGSLRQRLAGVLFNGAAVAGAAAVIVYLVDWAGDDEVQRGAYIGMGGALTLLVLAAVGYALAPTLLGQVAMVVGLGYGIPFTWDAFGDVTSLRLGLSFLAVGAGWLVLAETQVWKELLPARLIGSAFLLFGAQTLIRDHASVAYSVTLLVGIAGFLLYVSRHVWPYLALGVVAVTLAVPEALLDWTEGSLGTAAALLAAGATLLVSSLVGMRLRREAGSPPAPPLTARPSRR